MGAKRPLPYDESCASAAGQAALPMATFSVPSTPHAILSPGENATTSSSAGSGGRVGS